MNKDERLNEILGMIKRLKKAKIEIDEKHAAVQDVFHDKSNKELWFSIDDERLEGVLIRALNTNELRAFLDESLCKEADDIQARINNYYKELDEL